MSTWNKVKITVVKKYLSEDLAKEYVTDELKAQNYGVCDAVKLGAEFILEDPGVMPAGFCPWAWCDINRDVVSMMAGGDFPWINKKGVAIASCSDGLRPVVFLIERI